MLNILTQTKPWVVASLLVATSVFAQNGNKPYPVPQRTHEASKSRENICPTPAKPYPCSKPKCAAKPCPAPCPQPCPPTQICEQPKTSCPEWRVPVLNAGYGYPAAINTRCPWHVTADLSFILWKPAQDNMEFGVKSVGSIIAGATLNREVLNAEFDFQPGFKLGLGGNFDHDNWDMHAEYTWFHNTNDNSATANIFPTWGSPGIFFGTAQQYQSATEKWTLDMDLIDLDLGRWYYVGTQLTFHPTMGARAAIIGQEANLTYLSNTNTLAIAANTKSWALGPKLALDSNWNVGCGFRVYGNAEADLLFTQYTTLSSSQTNTDVSLVHNIIDKQNAVDTVRAHVDLEGGFGWGTYLNCNRWYLDFSAGYDFQVFFNQNMFRFFANDSMLGKTFSPNGNLYLQGLTLKAKLDF